MVEERKLVTVLFADIVGSTALGTTHDPEVIRSTVGRTFERLAGVLREHGGTVEKFIGDEVMAVFGIPAAHDDDADRAVRAAFALRDALGQLNLAGGPRLELRIGIGSGEVVTGGGTGGTDQFLVTGTPVNEAARLRASAAPGEIVVSALTHRLAHGVARYGGVRRVDAKGIGLIEAWPAEALTAALPEQTRGLAGMQAPLIGRDDELRLVEEAYRRTSQGERAYLLTLFGNAGAGKSRLAREFIARIGADRVRPGRCLPYGDGITFYAIQMIIRADTGITSADSQLEADAKLRAAVVRAFGDASPDVDAVHRRIAVMAGVAVAEHALTEVAPEDLTTELRWALRAYLEHRSASEPLVLVVEDIHWAEPALLDLIEHLADLSRGRLFILCLARPELLDARPGWGGGKLNAGSISLEPLSTDETRELIAELLAIDDLPEQLRAEVVSRAEGNPLFVEEFLRMLIDTEQVARRDGRWVAVGELDRLVVPPTIQGLIAARLDRLSPDVKATLQRAAVVGRVFATSAVAALGPDTSPVGALDEATRRDLVIEMGDRGVAGGRLYRFKHVLIRDVAYAAVPKADRARLHARYAEWYEGALGDRAEEFIEVIAYHAERAHALAVELGAPEAPRLGRLAFERLMRAATAARLRSDLGGARALYERARAIGSSLDLTPRERADAVGYAALTRSSVEATPESETALVDVLPLLRAAGPSGVFVRVLVSLAARRAASAPEEAKTMVAEAQPAAWATRDPDLVSMLMVFRDFTDPAMTVEDLRARRTERYEYLRAAGAERHWAGAAISLAWPYVLDGDFSQAKARLDEAFALVARTGSRSDRSDGLNILSVLERSCGRYDAARQMCETGLELSREMANRRVVARQLRFVGLCWTDLDRLDRALPLLEESLAMLSLESTPWQVPYAHEVLARAYLKAGDLVAARRHSDASDAAWARLPGATTGGNTVAPEVAAAEGDLASAERLYDSLFSARGWMPLNIAHLHEWRGLVRLRYGRTAEARQELVLARDFYSDPLAAPKRAELDALIARAETPTPTT